MWWKIYFWAVLIINLILYFYIASANSPKIGDLIGLIIAVISLIGLFAYTYKKAIFSKSFWKRFFWVFLLSEIIYFIYSYTPLENLIPLRELTTVLGNGNETALIQDLMIIILLSPLFFPHYYAIYKLGDKKNSIT